MINTSVRKIENETLSGKEFERLSKLIYEQCGIKMPPVKKIMLEARLRKRLRAWNMSSFTQYCDFLFSKEGISEELINMIDVVTTNKTDFFREPAQFTFLTQSALPSLLKNRGNDHFETRLKIWSAGCSTGEEPYTLGIVLSEFLQDLNDVNFSIIASDISTKVLEKAVMGIYNLGSIEGIPLNLKKKYFLKSKDSEKKLVRIVPQLRRTISFMRINFMNNDFGIKEKQDIIFCRNVIIYFDSKTQENLIKRLCNQLNFGGFLFLGHSETIFKIDVPMEQVAPSTYKKVR